MSTASGRLSSSAGDQPQPSRVREVLDRVGRALERARSAQRRRNAQRAPLGRALTGLVCLVAGLLVVVSAVNARGTDLRPGRNTDLVSLVQSQSRRNADLARQVDDVRSQVDTLSAVENSGSGLQQQLDATAAGAGYTAVTGPAVTVTLDDAPESVAADGVDPDLLVVHQQDIQGVVNVLWAGGAEAMTIQGQRVISTTGVKCVGNTVVLHGIPYAPPYVISAIGDPTRLRKALEDSRAVQIYRQYVAAYGLVFTSASVRRAQFPAHQGSLDLQHARPLGSGGGGSADGDGNGTPR